MVDKLYGYGFGNGFAAEAEPSEPTPVVPATDVPTKQPDMPDPGPSGGD